MSWAVYDLRWNSPSFDIFTFLQYANQRGLGGVWLKPGYNAQGLYDGQEGERKRVKTIVIPAIELHGLQWKLGGDPPEDIGWPKEGDKQRYAHRMNHLQSVKEPAKVFLPQEALDKANDRLGGKKRIVIIQRWTQYEHYRNTGKDWDRWASDHDAYVMPDFAVEEIPLAERLACYELSSLCMGVNCGNMAPNYYSYRPYITMKWLADPKIAKHGVGEGWRLPWQTKQQLHIWNDKDDYGAIDWAYAEWLSSSS